MRATLTASDFFLANLYPSGPFTCIFFKNLSRVFPVLAVVNTSSYVGHGVCFCLNGPFNCISFLECSFSPDVIPSGWLGPKHRLTLV